MRNKPITTNDVQPIQPYRPENGVYAKAKGPMITTSNVEEIKAMNAKADAQAAQKSDEPKPQRSTTRRAKKD